eukprot:Filipodium_phascolosomae@DN2705_c0_g4_i1.p1
MNQIRAKVVPLLLMCMLPHHRSVQARETFFDYRPNVDSGDSAELAGLASTIVHAVITNTVKAGATNYAHVDLQLRVGQDPPAVSVKLLFEAPAGFAFHFGDCRHWEDSSEPHGAICWSVAPGKAEWTFGTRLIDHFPYTLSMKLSAVPTRAASDANFVLTYSGATRYFAVSSFLRSVKGSAAAAKVGGDAEWAVMRPVNHTTTTIPNHVEFIFALTNSLSFVGDRLAIILPRNYTLIQDYECLDVQFRSCDSNRCTTTCTTLEKNKYKCTPFGTRTIQLKIIHPGITQTTFQVSFWAIAPTNEQASAGQATIISCRGECLVTNHANYLREPGGLDYGMTKDDVRVNSARAVSVGFGLVALLLASLQ